jgi:hypothetical protein
MRDHVKLLILESIANDYENFEAICQEVQKWASEEGLVVDKCEIATHLSELLFSGDVHAYELSSQSGKASQVVYDERKIDQLWFFPSTP